MTYSITAMTHDEIVDNLKIESINNLQKELHSRISPAKKDLDKGRPFQIAKEAWEYALADATEWNGGKWVGHGNSAEDVVVGKNKYDIKGLGTGSERWTTTSGEASVKQTLRSDAKIDESFLRQDGAQLWSGVVDSWMQKVTNEGKYFITVFWRNTKTLAVRLVMFKVNPKKFPKFDSSQCVFSDSKSQMLINNIVDPEQAKLYVLRSKHRMEIRIKGKYFDADSNRYVEVYKGL